MGKKPRFGLPFEDLNKPLPPERYRSLLDDGSSDTNRVSLESKKLIMLLMHYDLGFGDYRGLALTLAREYIPGFMEEVPRGRRKKWTSSALGALFVDVEREAIRLGLAGKKRSPVFPLVASQLHWANFLDSTSATGTTPDPVEAIRRAYFKAKNDKWSAVFWKAYLWHEHEGTVEEWDEILRPELINSGF